MKPPKRIAVDFDGTLCEDRFPSIGSIKPGAREALISFRRQGYQVVIWSCRACHWDYDVYGGDPTQPVLQRERVRAMIEWLEAHEIPYDEIDDGSKGKPGAQVYIDDKALRFNDNWKEIMDVFQRFTDATSKKMGKLVPFPVKSIDPVPDATGDPNGEGPIIA